MKNTKKALLTLIIVLFFLWLFLKNIDIEKTKTIIKNTRLFWVYFMLPFYLLIYILRALRWKLIVENGYKLKFFNVFSSNIIGFAINYTLPARIGEYARAYILGKKEEKSVSYIFGTVIIERILDLGAMAFFMAVFYLDKNRFIEKFRAKGGAVSVIEEGSLMAVFAFLGFIFLFYIVFLFENKTLNFLKKITSFLPKKFGNSLYNFGEKFIEGIIALFKNRNKILIILLSILIWTVIALSYMVALRDFGLKTNFFDIIPYVIALLAGASVPTPGMVGSFHAASFYALKELYLLDKNVAGAASFIVHLGLIFTTLLLSLPFVIIEAKTISEFKKEKK